jgi:Ca2+-binding RTX toxin-like protein
MRAGLLTTFLIGAATLTGGVESAGATTVRSSTGQLYVTGGVGEVNNVTLIPDYVSPSDAVPENTVHIQDTRPIAVRSTPSGPGCIRVRATAVNCPFPSGGALVVAGDRPFVIDLGDRDDRLAIAPGSRLSPEFDTGTGFFVEVRDGPGDDRMRSNISTARFVMGPGNDVALGASLATPSYGSDTITGTVGADILDGGPGQDHIRGGNSTDVIRGGTGNDRLFGERGTDRLFGGLGNDYLNGGPHPDRLFGGPGRNTLIPG